MIGIYHKDYFNEYMSPFVDELKGLEEKGISVGETTYNIVTKAIIADQRGKADILDNFSNHWHVVGERRKV